MSVPVHPRACGGNLPRLDQPPGAAGASPRLRGKLPRRRRSAGRRGCIPAPAGETPAGGPGRAPAGVHPRACGGNGSALRGLGRARGASPRLRGKQPVAGGVQVGRGCIPAPAGETRPGPHSRWSRPVHPRACGGNNPALTGRAADDGASPRLRGKRAAPRHRGGRSGCIPAPAGETSRRAPALSRRWVHPRACGGNGRGTPAAGGCRGASPRLRGKLHHPLGRGGRRGCIPAPAGETGCPAGSAGGWGVHPRACGGNVKTAARGTRIDGASPRLRGKRDGGIYERDRLGCIPAPAGETKSWLTCGRRAGVHPRACGGNVLQGRNSARFKGASPRLRGKQLGDESLDPGPGCIPAPAGETPPRPLLRPR